MDKIAFAKIGWAEFYNGDQIIGEHEYIRKLGDGHERFNFKKVNGRYYGYIPPTGGRKPNPKEKDGWYIIFVAKYKGEGKLVVVGWYENATFAEDERPEYQKEKFEFDVNDKKYRYNIYSEKAVLLPVTERYIDISGKHFRRANIVYVKGNNVDEDKKWRKILADLASKIIKRYSECLVQITVAFPDQEIRNKIEQKAIDYVISEHRKNKFIVIDRQNYRCGYDLLVKKDKQEYFLEVKGTASKIPHFYITRNEKRYIDDKHPKWKLIIVTNVLEKPTMYEYRAEEVEDKFKFKPLEWEGIFKGKL